MKISDYSKGNTKDLKKKAKISIIFTLVSVIAVVVFSILHLNAMIVIPFILIAVISFVKWIQYHNGVARLNNIYCSCGNKFDYPNDVKYEIMDKKTTSNKQQNYVARVTKQTVKFICKCRKCNKEKEFIFQFIIKEEKVNLLGNVLDTKEYLLEDQIKKYFEN